MNELTGKVMELTGKLELLLPTVEQLSRNQSTTQNVVSGLQQNIKHAVRDREACEKRCDGHINRLYEEGKKKLNKSEFSVEDYTTLKNTIEQLKTAVREKSNRTWDVVKMVIAVALGSVGGTLLTMLVQSLLRAGR